MGLRFWVKLVLSRWWIFVALLGKVFCCWCVYRKYVLFVAAVFHTIWAVCVNCKLCCLQVNPKMVSSSSWNVAEICSYFWISTWWETGQSRVYWCINHLGAESCSLVLGNQRSSMGIQTLIQFQSSAINICDMCPDTELKVSFPSQTAAPQCFCDAGLFILRTSTLCLCWLAHSENITVTVMSTHPFRCYHCCVIVSVFDLITVVAFGKLCETPGDWEIVSHSQYGISVCLISSDTVWCKYRHNFFMVDCF